jgi:hypothetical protein
MATSCRNGDRRPERGGSGGVSPDALAAARPLRWALLLGAALLMVLRAPVYLSSPSFWAEEGTLYFALAWQRPLREALIYRPAGYLLLPANLATTLAAALVRAGVLPLARAPLVTVLVALAVQVLPVGLVAWSRAPFWGSPLRRSVGVAIVLFGALTDEIWLNTINSQPWLVVVTALLLLEPPDVQGGAARTRAAVLTFAGLSAPAASALAPLFAWRAWRSRTRPAVVQAALLAACAAVQIACLWSAAGTGQHLPSRTVGLDLGVFAATVWVRTLIVPTLGPDVAQRASVLLQRAGAIAPLEGVLLLALAAGAIAWLARGLRADERLALVGAYAVVTPLTLLTAVGDKAMLLRGVWASSRYVYAPGILVLLVLLGGARRGSGRLRPLVCALLLATGLVQGAAHYPTSLRWQPSWPSWPDEVRAWEADPSRPLRIWPPPWAVGLARPRA